MFEGDGNKTPKTRHLPTPVKPKRGIFFSGKLEETKIQLRNTGIELHQEKGVILSRASNQGICRAKIMGDVSIIAAKILEVVPQRIWISPKRGDQNKSGRFIYSRI